MTLKEIKDINWHYLINRREPLLFKSITNESNKYFPKLTGIDWRSNYSLRFNDGSFFVNINDLNLFRQIFSKGGLKHFYLFRRCLLLHIKELDRITKKVEDKDYSKLSNSQLLKELKQYLNFSLKAHAFLLPFPLSDKLLSEKIVSFLPKSSEEQRQAWLRTLTFPSKENEHLKEERSFFKLCRLYQRKSKDFSRQLFSHLQQFGWIGGRCLWEKGWTEKDIQERISNLFEQKKNPSRELKNLDKVRQNKFWVKLIKELKVKRSPEFYKYVLLAREFVYLRTWRTDVIYRAFYRMRNLFREIAKRVELKNKDDIRFLTFQEVVAILKNGRLAISWKEIEKRKSFYATIVVKNNYQIFAGKKWRSKFKFLEKEIGVKKEIPGQTAFKGKVRGRVKVVRSNDDLKKVARNDILVAPMTFPHFISAMEKSAAFVTDEGGILCHAAIISREMKKPCIIGTKNATKILHDGDLVEVNADQGIVKILKRNKNKIIKVNSI